MAFSSFDTLDPKDLSFLRGILEEVCRDRSLDMDGDEAADIARSLVNWYLFGVKEEDALKQMLEPLGDTKPQAQ
ncbi:hypothetical protein ACFSE1_16945 [Rhizobium helianthi]|uniref:Uncharacterized protein n=1 Tax=Rhizobium helianthi TaxID=1132695 RepID=A0ABW4M7F2_9HYPH